MQPRREVSPVLPSDSEHSGVDTSENVGCGGRGKFLFSFGLWCELQAHFPLGEKGDRSLALFCFAVCQFNSPLPVGLVVILFCPLLIFFLSFVVFSIW